LEADVALVGRIDAVPKILEVVCRATGMGFAAVARVTPERWIACAVRDEIAFGLVPGGELEVATTICDEIRQSSAPVIIDHVAEDPAFRSHHTPLKYGFQSYISVPIRHRGEFFGTLCAIDPEPRRLNTPDIRGMFELFAELIGSHLDGQEQLARSEAALLDERAVAELREQFIAVLGHDLRNPLASIAAGARLLRKTPLSERGTALVDGVEKSVDRMGRLISDVLDLARGRLGGGVEVEKRHDPKLEATLHQVAAELALAQPHRAIAVDIALTEPVACDTGRIAQMLSNLLANALTHGAEDQPVRVLGRTAEGNLELSVTNAGEPISTLAKEHLFQPFYRSAARPTGQGLGLGLYIASQIAKAHGGTLDVQSGESETRFTYRAPLA
jgi:signal transduction histidine kinase